jgi:AcrR family transcriptional regulator
MTSDADHARPAGGTQPPGRRPALTREQILTAALQIIDEDGVEALTMRRLGQALARNPMAIYRHAADKDALLDGVVEHVAAQLVAPRRPDRNGHRAGDGAGDGDGAGAGAGAGDVSGEGDHAWDAVLRRIAHTFRRVALAHPHVVPLLLTRPLSGPLALRPLGTLRQLEELLELFVTAGFDPQGALHAARLFTGFLYGHVLHELQDQIDNPDETDDLLRLGLHRLPLTQFPRLRSLAAVLATYDGAAELDEGLSIVLAGLRSQLRT